MVILTKEMSVGEMCQFFYTHAATVRFLKKQLCVYAIIITINRLAMDISQKRNLFLFPNNYTETKAMTVSLLHQSWTA